MKKKIVKALSVMLVVALTLTAAPLSGFVGLELPEWLDFSIMSNAEDVATSGTCGDNLTWTFDESTGILTISGTGAMENYLYDHYCPWNKYQNNIKDVIIGYGVTTIGDNAFSRCDILTSVTIGNSVTRIGEEAFYGCNSLASITIPDSVTSIGNYAFSGCHITNVTIGNSVTTIGNHAFSGSNIASVTIPNSVITIGGCAFQHCNNLTSVTIGDDVEIIGGSVKEVGERAFAYCTNLTNVTIGNSVTTVGDEQFYHCINLTSVTIGNGVKSIGSYAFGDCTSLEKISLGNNVESIESEAFYNTAFYNNENNWEDNVLYIGKYLIKANICISGDYIIKTGTISIGDFAFVSCSNLTSVIFPDSVKSIGSYAFKDCTSLEKISLGNNIESIGSYAFYNTAFYNNINNWEDNVLYIERYLIKANTNVSGDYIINAETILISDSAFRGCTSLTSITIPDGVTKIGDHTFSNCEALTSVIIPDGVTRIGDSAFGGCNSLASITIPDGVTKIGDSAFSSCSSLKNFTMPKDIQHIGRYAFSSCSSLISVSIPEDVTTIGYSVFYYCDNFVDVYYSGTENKWNNIYIEEPNYILLNATIHFNSTGPDYMTFSQTHVISDYSSKYDDYEEQYFDSFATAMDGTDGTVDYCIPGLQEGEEMIPQGITYYPEKDWILISAYNKDKEKASVIYALDKTTGKYVAQFDIYNDTTLSTAHLGGIAVSDYNLYFSYGSSIAYIPLSELNVSVGTVKRITIVDTKSLSSQVGDASISYVTLTDGVLYAGNFYNETDDYNTRACDDYASVVVGYTISGTSSEDEWKKLDVTLPSYKYNISDKSDIIEIQSATVKNGYLYLSCSYGRNNDSSLKAIYVGNNTSMVCEIIDDACVSLPMMEGIVFIDGYLYTIFESASDYYFNDILDKSENPTDVIWKINYNNLFELDIYNLGEETYSFGNYSDSDSNGGHCFGVSMTSAGYYNKILDITDIGGNAENDLYTLSNNATVKEPICHYQKIQGSVAKKAMVAGGSAYASWFANLGWFVDIESDWKEVIDYVKDHQFDNKGTLQIGYRKMSQGGHAINFLRYEVVDGQERIYAYDNNFPNVETYFYMDSDGNVYQAPYSTFDGAVDSICLRDISKYFKSAGEYNSTRVIYADSNEISIEDASPYLMECGNASYTMFELSDGVTSVTIKPLVDNATFTYDGEEFSFNEVNENTVGELVLSIHDDDSTTKPEFIVTENTDESECGHAYESIVTAPTCTIGGYTTYVCLACGDTYTADEIGALGHSFENGSCDVCGETDPDYVPGTPDEPEYNYTFSVQTPSKTTISKKNGIILHANVEGTAPEGSYVVWTSSNNKFTTSTVDDNSLKIISNKNGYTTFTATLYDADGEILAIDSIEMRSKAGFFDVIASWFRKATVYES